MADPIAVFACSRHSGHVGFGPCDVLHPRTSSLDLSSAGFITSTTRGLPETDRRSADRERRGAGPSHVRALLPRSSASDPGVAGPRSGAAPPSPRPILAAALEATSQQSALFRRTGCHHACADAKCPCVTACPHNVLEIRPLTAADKRQLSLGDRFRAWVHRNRQAYVIKADVCTACARCVQACPVPHVIRLKRKALA